MFLNGDIELLFTKFFFLSEDFLSSPSYVELSGVLENFGHLEVFGGIKDTRFPKVTLMFV